MISNVSDTLVLDVPIPTTNEEQELGGSFYGKGSFHVRAGTPQLHTRLERVVRVAVGAGVDCATTISTAIGALSKVGGLLAFQVRAQCV